MSKDPCPGCGGCGTCLSRDRYWDQEGYERFWRDVGRWMIVFGLAVAMLFVYFVVSAQAKDCYVQRFSHTTSVTCDDGETIINEDNTRDRYGRKDNMPSLRREPNTLYREGNRSTYCSQTGSILTCR